MNKGGRKHKRQATRRRKKSTNAYLEKGLKRFSKEYSTERWFRPRFSWRDEGRSGCRAFVGNLNRSWKSYRSNQYKVVKK